MKYTEPIEFPGTDNVLQNIEFYNKKFLEDGLIVFRNANLTHEDQSFFHSELAKLFNYNIVLSSNGVPQYYIENHSKRELLQQSGRDELLVGWRLEHIYDRNPIVISTWNMTTFTTDNENGKTYFVDCEKMYNKMSYDWKNFLKLCKIKHSITGIWDNDDEYSIIDDHWITKNPSPRISVRDSTEYLNILLSVNGEEPTGPQKQLFHEISTWMSNYICRNEENTIVHKWQQGDLVIQDLFKLAHSDTGGFIPEEREFIGMWGYKDPK